MATQGEVVQVRGGELQFPACYNPDGFAQLLSATSDAQATRLLRAYECFWLFTGDSVSAVGNAMPTSVGGGKSLRMKFVLTTKRGPSATDGFGQGWFPIAFLVSDDALVKQANLTGVWKMTEGYVYLRSDGKADLMSESCEHEETMDWAFNQGILEFDLHDGEEPVRSVVVSVPAKPEPDDVLKFASDRQWRFVKHDLEGGC